MCVCVMCIYTHVKERVREGERENQRRERYKEEYLRQEGNQTRGRRGQRRDKSERCMHINTYTYTPPHMKIS